MGEVYSRAGHAAGTARSRRQDFAGRSFLSDPVPSSGFGAAKRTNSSLNHRAHLHVADVGSQDGVDYW